MVGGSPASFADNGIPGRVFRVRHVCLVLWAGATKLADSKEKIQQKKKRCDGINRMQTRYIKSQEDSIGSIGQT